MNSRLECIFIERTKDEWYYILENFDAPKHAWDWKDYATAYGSFTNKANVVNHLLNNHSNLDYSII